MPALPACPCDVLCIEPQEPRTQVASSKATFETVAPSPWPCAGTMKMKILHFSLLFAATTAKDVYAEGATTDSPGAEAVVPAAKLGVNEAPAANHRRMANMGHLTGEEACENHDLSFEECQNVGCCQWAACPSKSAGEFRAYSKSAVGWRGGQCHSAASVQNGQCTSVPWERHDEDGPHCWRRELMSGASGWEGCGAETCDVCMGDCDSNADCKSGLSCFQRNGNTPVPGCSGDGVSGYDYCVVPELTSGASGWGGCGAEKCDACMGDCDSNADCKSGLSCFQRNYNTPVPGCSGDGVTGYDYCVVPELAAGANGWEGCGTDKCDVCMGDCDSNEDCKSGLSCFHRNGFTKVPGCSGDGVLGADYCIV